MFQELTAGERTFSTTDVIYSDLFRQETQQIRINTTAKSVDRKCSPTLEKYPRQAEILRSSPPASPLPTYLSEFTFRWSSLRDSAA